MNAANSSSNEGLSVDSIVARLESLLDEEFEVLRRCDHARLDEVTNAKLELWQQLMEVSPKSAGAGEQLLRLRRKTLLNQSLIVHARDTVRGILALAGHQVSSDLPGGHSSGFGGGLRIDLRG